MQAAGTADRSAATVAAGATGDGAIADGASGAPPAFRRVGVEEIYRGYVIRVTKGSFEGPAGERFTRDEDAVDTQLRVRGIQGVRVADASAIPVPPVSALNAPSMMIALRCVAFLRQEPDGQGR